MEQTRQDLEEQGYVFHPGTYHKETGRFVCSDMPPDHTPPYLDTLIAGNYVRVPGGIMEPPRTNPLLILGGFALLGGAMFLAKKFMG